MVSAPMDSIADAVASGSNPAYGDLQPVVRQPRRRLVRYLATAGFATKMLFGAAALAAVTTTAAVTGTLPNPVQDFVSDSVGNVGIQIPRGSESTSPPDTLPIPTSTVPVGPIEYRTAVQEHNSCVQDSRTAYRQVNGNVSGFDAAAACGDRPDSKEFEKPGASNRQNGSSNTSTETGPPSESPSDTRPGGTKPPKPPKDK